MSLELTKQEAEIAIQFLNRVDLKGAESEAMAMLRQKLRMILAAEEQPSQPSQPAQPEGAKVTDLVGLKGEDRA